MHQDSHQARGNAPPEPSTDASLYDQYAQIVFAYVKMILDQNLGYVLLHSFVAVKSAI